MNGIALIVGRELSAYFRGLFGYIIISVLLLVCGLLFYGVGMSEGERASAEVLRAFFYMCSGCTMIGGVLLSMRLFAEEARDGTLVVLTTAPISEWQIVLGKWFSAWLMLTVFHVLTLYMPLMISIHGNVSWGQIGAGYLGLVLLGGATTAIAAFASSLTKSQVIAVVVGGAIVAFVVLLWRIAKVAEPPFDTVFGYLALYDKHFTPFMKGQVHLRDIVYYVGVMFLALLSTRQILSARRWRG